LVTCRDFLKELSDYLDSNTSPEMRQELESHVNNCPNCWVVFDTTKKTLKVYKGLDAEHLPENLHDRLMDALRKKCSEKGGCEH
jgi:anti-sigma factor (TIGR02949 family)